MESLFTLALAAANELTIAPDAQGVSPVEAMDDSAEARAQRMLPGITIIRTSEGNGAVPSDSFFLKLAIRGTPADVAFFQLRAATANERGTPSWITMVTDYSGCTSFGSGDLVRAWGSWSKYRRHHPARYASNVAEALEDIERELLQGDCVCGGKDDLVRELQLFLDKFPRSPLGRRIRTRMDSIRRETTPIRYHCLPG